MIDTSLGIYCHKDKKFYYLETGDNYIANTLDRVRKALIQRELLAPPIGGNFAGADYDVFTVHEAKKKDLDFVPIFLSTHVKALHEQREEKKGGQFR